jgi:hypothetical protein
MSGGCLTSIQNIRLCGKPVSRADGQLTVQNGYARAALKQTLAPSATEEDHLSAWLCAGRRTENAR